MQAPNAKAEMPQVLLVIPPGEPGTTPNREGAAGLGGVSLGEGGFRYAPQMMATVAQELFDAGIRVAALDAPALELDLHQATKRTLRSGASLVCVQVSWATRAADQAYVDGLGDMPCLAIGPSARFMRSNLGQAEWVLEGDPVGRTAEIVERILAGNNPPHWIDGSAGSRDCSPVPAWHLWPLDRYTHLSMSASRGCDAECLWCPYVVAQGERFLPRAAEDVVAEMETLVQRYHPARIIMRDPAFACDLARAKRICRLILRSSVLTHGKAVSWECESRPEHFDGELVRLLSLAGCMGIKVGLESIDPEFLYAQRRIAALDDASAYLSGVAELARSCRTWGMALRLYTMVGLPGQTQDSCTSTALYSQAIRPASLSVKAFERYPGLRGEYGVLTDQCMLDEQMAPLLEAQAAIRALPKSKSSRARRALWRFVYRAINRISGGA